MERYTYDEDIIRLELNLIFLLDTSGSMMGERINQLNLAMNEALQLAEETSIAKEVKVNMRVVRFNDYAEWIYGNAEQGLQHIDWNDLTAGDSTNTAAAIDKSIEVMHRTILGTRNYKPVIILITDGLSNEPDETLRAIERLKKSLKSSKDPNADKIIRIALGVVGANQDELRAFASIGDIVHADGTTEENVPLVFNVDNIDLLSSILAGVTVSSIIASICCGVGDNTEDEKVVIKDAFEEYEDDDDLEF